MDEALKLLAEKLIVLSAEDRNRMSRLYEEVRTRLEEMAMISSRTLRLSADCRSEAEFTYPFVQGEPEFGAVALVRPHADMSATTTAKVCALNSTSRTR